MKNAALSLKKYNLIVTFSREIERLMTNKPCTNSNLNLIVMENNWKKNKIL